MQLHFAPLRRATLERHFDQVGPFGQLDRPYVRRTPYHLDVDANLSVGLVHGDE